MVRSGEVDDEEAKDALEELLGIQLDALNDEAWDNQSESSADHRDDEVISPTFTAPSAAPNSIQPAVKLTGTDNLFENAYVCSGHCTSCPEMQKPAVTLVRIEGRGNALTAAKNFDEHETVFTEVAKVSYYFHMAASEDDVVSVVWSAIRLLLPGVPSSSGLLVLPLEGVVS